MSSVTSLSTWRSQSQEAEADGSFRTKSQVMRQKKLCREGAPGLYESPSEASRSTGLQMYEVMLHECAGKMNKKLKAEQLVWFTQGWEILEF